MDHRLRNRILFFCPTAVLGGLSMLLHRYMMENCFDEKGLLIAGNLPGRMLWVIGIGFAAYLLVLLRTIGGDGAYEDNFPRCLLRGLLMAAGGAVLAKALPELGLAATWQTALAAGAAASMGALGVFRMLGKRPVFGFSALVCLFYMLMLVTNYRLWSADPQFHDYAYQLLACVLLMLCSFHRTCCDAGIIQRKKLIFTGLTAALCSMAALSGDFMPGFYLASALWAAGCVCSVAVLPPDPEEEEGQPEPEQEASETAQEEV